MAHDQRMCSRSGVSAVIHLQTCPHHDDSKTGMCFGTLKSKGSCVNRATDSPEPGMLPTCKIHREQRRALGSCQAKLSCRFECGRLLEWKPYGFQLCPIHREHPLPCYFLGVPAEVRLRVYQFLLPDGLIPARYIKSESLRMDGGPVYTAILCVNKQIHDEATRLLYATRVFTVEISEGHLSMCRSAQKLSQHFVTNHGNHALQDYQMQLMLLEQRNKRRLLIARQELNITNRDLSRAPTRAGASITAEFPTPDATGPIWHPAISMRYFNMIRHFLIELTFPFQRSKHTNANINVVPNVDETRKGTLELRLYDYCDSIHRLIGRIQLLPSPVAQLEINISFSNNYRHEDDVFTAASVLLRPFQRSRSFAKPRVLSITMNDSTDNEREILTQDWHVSATSRTFFEYLEHWNNELSNIEAPFKTSEVFDAYWQLESLFLKLKEQANYGFINFGEITLLLHAARVARETDDLIRFREIWNQVLNIWFDYLKSEKDLQSHVACSIDFIQGTIERDCNRDDTGGSAGI